MSSPWIFILLRTRGRGGCGISVSRLYDLRCARRYVEEALHIEKTKPVRVPIGERRKSKPNGVPGFLRVDIGRLSSDHCGWSFFWGGCLDDLLRCISYAILTVGHWRDR